MFAALSARMHDATTIYLTVEEPAGGGLAVPDGRNGPWTVGTPEDASMEFVEAVDANTIAVHIDTPVVPGDAVTLTYQGSIMDAADKVQGLDAGQNPVYLADFSGMTVTNALGGGGGAHGNNNRLNLRIGLKL